MAARMEKTVTMSFGVSTHCQARMRCWRNAVLGGRFLCPSFSEAESPASLAAPRRRRNAMVGYSNRRVSRSVPRCRDVKKGVGLKGSVSEDTAPFDLAAYCGPCIAWQKGLWHSLPDCGAAPKRSRAVARVTCPCVHTVYSVLRISYFVLRNTRKLYSVLRTEP